MIEEKRKELNMLVRKELEESGIHDPYLKEALLQNLIDSLESTNGYDNETKLQKVSECTETQSRIIARMCISNAKGFQKVEDKIHSIYELMEKNQDTTNKQFDELKKSINDYIKSINESPINKDLDYNGRKGYLATIFNFITANSIPFTIIVMFIILLAFLTGNLDHILQFFHH